MASLPFLNKYWMKEILNNDDFNTNFENFYKYDLVEFCTAAKEEILLKNKRITELENEIRIIKDRTINDFH